MTRLRFSVLFVFGVVASGLTASSVWAGPEVGIEVDLAIPVGDTADAVDLGWGLEGRAGFGLPIPALDFAVEALFDFASFPITGSDVRADVIRVAGGVRVGVPVPIVPAVFAHVGYGNLSIELAGIDASDDGLTWDVGLASDLLSLPLVAVGLHVGYKQVVLSDSNFNWVGIGLHATFGF